MAMRRSLGSTIDPGVFGVYLGISMLFVLWGVFFTDNLSAVASAALGFLIDAFGWVFILATFAFLVFVIFLAFSRYGRILRQDKAWHRRRRAGVQDVVVGRDDVQRGDGHRAYVLRGRGAHLSHVGSAERPGETGHGGGCGPGDGVLLLPLGVAPVGDLRRGRPVASLLHLPQGEEEPHKLGVLPDPREPGRRSCRQGDRLPGDLRHAVRDGDLAGAGGLADQRRSELPL